MSDLQNLIPISCVLAYIAASLLQGFNLSDKRRIPMGAILTLGGIAALLHGFLLYRWIDSGAGQNLTYLNILSQLGWLVVLMVTLTAIKRPVAALITFIYPFAALTIPLVLFFPGQHIIATGSNPHALIHISLSILAYGVMGFAAVQALFLALQERRLHVNHGAGMIQALPPLETMESFLFQIITVGFVLLTGVLVTSFLFFNNLFAPQVVAKTILGLMAWCIYAGLLAGRCFAGWRGQVASYWTLTGTFLLILAYFGTQFIYGTPFSY